MKLAKATGFFGGLLVVIGAILRVMHLPGAAYPLPIGALLLIVAAVAWFAASLRIAEGGLLKFTLFVLFISILVQIIGSLFKVMHYPGSAWPWNQTQVALLIVLMICGIALYIQAKADARVDNMIMFLAFYFGMTGFFMVKGGLPNHILEGFSYPDQALIRSGNNINAANQDLYKAISDNARDNADQLRQKSNELVDFISSVKIKVLNASKGDTKEISGDEAIYKMNFRSDYDHPTAELFGPDEMNPKPGNAAQELKNRINTYRDWIQHTFPDPVLSEKIGLRTDGCDLHDNEKQSWEQCNFMHKPVASIVMVLDQLRQEVRTTEAIVLQRLVLSHSDTTVAVNKTISENP